MQSDSDFFFMFFWLEPKEPKIQEKKMRSAFFSAPRTRTGWTVVIFLRYRKGRLKTLLRVIDSNWRR